VGRKEEYIMSAFLNIIADEKGSAIVIALMILSLLTIVGIAATRTSDSEISIAGNEVAYNMVLYDSEGASVEGALNVEVADKATLTNRSPLWLYSDTAAPDYTDPATWDFNDADGDDNAEESSIDQDLAFASVDLGIAPGYSLSMTQKTQVRSYRIFGYENTRTGQSLVEVGYKKRF
jgi:hypothetical protein